MSVAAPNNEDREDEALKRAQRAHEPSMEEILASIRAIIADDREPAAPAKPGPQIVYSSDQPRVQAAEPATAVAWARPAQMAAEPSEPDAPAPTVVWSRPAEPLPEEAPEPLLSEESGGSVAASFDALSATLAAQGLEVAERLTREMLKPMLKSWLDEHMPPLVEKLVRAEISRITRSGR
jgi:cell pole-organizing protein PopZ